MNKKILFLGIFMYLIMSIPAFASVSKEPVLVVSNGVGIGVDREEALHLAWKDAVKNAIGLAVDSTRIQKDNKIIEAITVLSRGYIEKYKIIKEEITGDFVTVKVKAWIRRDLILNGLLSKKSSEDPIDGRNLYASSLTSERQISEGVEILNEWITSFKYENYIDVSVSNFAFRHGAGELDVEINLEFDSKNYYSDFACEMTRILDYVSSAKVHNVPMVLPLNSKSGEVFPAFKRNTMTEYRKLMGRDSLKKRDGNVYLVTSNFYFSSYTLPSDLFNALWRKLWKEKRENILGAFFNNGSLLISLKNKDGVEVFKDFRNIHIDNVIVFPDPAMPLFSENKSHDGQVLYMIPGFGNKFTETKSDYKLFPSVKEKITIKVAPDILRTVSSVACSIVLKR